MLSRDQSKGGWKHVFPFIYTAQKIKYCQGVFFLKRLFKSLGTQLKRNKSFSWLVLSEYQNHNIMLAF